MKTLKKSPIDKAREALEALEQAYAYYAPEPQPKDAQTAEVEYFEYAPAA